jgi:hypothetical protein
MRFTDAFKAGFRVINRNLPLVAVQIVAMIINIAGLIFLVVLPIVIAIAIMGIDITMLSDMKTLPYSIGGYIGRYFFLFLIGIFFILLYLLIVTTFALYVFGASSGVLAHSVQYPSEKLSLKLFFSEGNRLFLPMIRYMTAASLLFLLLLVVGILVLIPLFTVIESIKSMNMTAGFFFGIFFILLALSVMLFAITACLAVFFYGSAILIFRGKKAFASIKEAARYLYRRQNAYWLYCLLLGGSVGLSLVLALVGMPMSAIPVIGPLFSIPYHLLTYVIQTYFSLFVTSAIFVFYFSTEEVIEIPSTPAIDTLFPESPGQPEPPQG